MTSKRSVLLWFLIIGGMIDKTFKLVQMEFMLETIFDIKNNKKRTKEDSSPHTRIKKWLQKVPSSAYFTASI